MLAAELPQNTIGPSLMWIGAVIAGLRRGRPIGGWLFFFFWQAVAGFAVTVAYTDWSRFAPNTWTNQGQYFAFVLSAAPRLATFTAVVAAGVMLLRTYEWRWVVVLRSVLILFSVFGAVSVAADSFYFPDRVSMDAASLILPVAFSIYFFVSARVKSVFVDRVWEGRGVQATAP